MLREKSPEEALIDRIRALFGCSPVAIFEVRRSTREDP